VLEYLYHCLKEKRNECMNKMNNLLN
jgi:hypothetical protein